MDAVRRSRLGKRKANLLDGASCAKSEWGDVTMNRSERRLQARGERIVLFVVGVFLLSSLLSVGTTAAQNTAFGTGALPSNSGTYNSAFGFFSLFNNTSGSQNTASGALALLNNTVGSENTAMGLYSLVNNTEGFLNTAIGF
jgi:hypothetical protein